MFIVSDVVDVCAERREKLSAKVAQDLISLANILDVLQKECERLKCFATLLTAVGEIFPHFDIILRQPVL